MNRLLVFGLSSAAAFLAACAGRTPSQKTPSQERGSGAPPKEVTPELVKKFPFLNGLIGYSIHDGNCPRVSLISPAGDDGYQRIETVNTGGEVHTRTCKDLGNGTSQCAYVYIAPRHVAENQARQFIREACSQQGVKA